MKLGCLFTIIAAALSFASGYAEWSPYWAIIPILLAGALLMGAYSYDIVMRGNERGSLTTLPFMWFSHCISPTLISFIFWLIGRFLRGF